MPVPKFSDEVRQGIANAVNDIREKCIEEPWYGRQLQDEGITLHWPEAKEPEQGREQEPEKEVDIDR